MKECSADLHRVADEPDRQRAIGSLVEEYIRREKRFAGIGHPHLDPVDPRAERLFDLADAEGVSGEYVDVLHAVRDTFEDEMDASLPINVTGAIAAISADMGLPPSAARGIAIVSRTAGVLAEILEEQETPIAGEVWQHVDQNASGPSS